jgi:hypothetical protein
MSNHKLSFCPKPEIAEAVRVEAEKERRTVSSFVALLVEDALAARRIPADEQRTAA